MSLPKRRDRRDATLPLPTGTLKKTSSRWMSFQWRYKAGHHRQASTVGGIPAHVKVSLAFGLEGTRLVRVRQMGGWRASDASKAPNSSSRKAGKRAKGGADQSIHEPGRPLAHPRRDREVGSCAGAVCGGAKDERASEQAANRARQEGQRWEAQSHTRALAPRGPA